MPKDVGSLYYNSSQVRHFLFPFPHTVPILTLTMEETTHEPIIRVCLQRHLVHTKRPLKFGPVRMSLFGPQQLVAGIYLVLSKMYTLRKCPWVQISHKVYFYLWFTELIHKKLLSYLIGQLLYYDFIANSNFFFALVI